jgi:hypothetical protein
MKIRILGAGWYGCSIALGLISDNHEVEVHEIADRPFSGASGGNPARLHQGWHYPRSGRTIDACLDHQWLFMHHYGHLTRNVPINIYAIAADDSLVDFRQYRETYRNRVDCIEVKPEEHGLQNVEGAVMTGERHMVIDMAREWFATKLDGRIKFGVQPGDINDTRWDLTIDCTFCANDEANIDRYEPCVTALALGPTNKAVTIMDGPFGSIYPWNEDQGLVSITSAKLTPISKSPRTYAEAAAILKAQDTELLKQRGAAMMKQMAHFWPEAADIFKIVDYKKTIRAMPRSGADSRLVDIVNVGERALRVRAGKIDAVFHAEGEIKKLIRSGEFKPSTVWEIAE